MFCISNQRFFAKFLGEVGKKVSRCELGAGFGWIRWGPALCSVFKPISPWIGGQRNRESVGRIEQGQIGSQLFKLAGHESFDLGDRF